jgi:hypothetical protein
MLPLDKAGDMQVGSLISFVCHTPTREPDAKSGENFKPQTRQQRIQRQDWLVDITKTSVS